MVVDCSSYAGYPMQPCWVCVLRTTATLLTFTTIAHEQVYKGARRHKGVHESLLRLSPEHFTIGAWFNMMRKQKQQIAWIFDNSSDSTKKGGGEHRKVLAIVPIGGDNEEGKEIKEGGVSYDCDNEFNQDC